MDVCYPIMKSAQLFQNYGTRVWGFEDNSGDCAGRSKQQYLKEDLAAVLGLESECRELSVSLLIAGLALAVLFLL